MWTAKGSWMAPKVIEGGAGVGKQAPSLVGIGRVRIGQGTVRWLVIGTAAGWTASARATGHRRLTSRTVPWPMRRPPRRPTLVINRPVPAGSALSDPADVKENRMSTSAPDPGSTQIALDRGLVAARVVTGDRARAIFGQVMGLVALTVGCLALGAYIGRDLSGAAGIAFFIGGFACVFGLNVASSRGNEQ